MVLFQNGPFSQFPFQKNNFEDLNSRAVSFQRFLFKTFLFKLLILQIFTFRMLLSRCCSSECMKYHLTYRLLKKRISIGANYFLGLGVFVCLHDETVLIKSLLAHMSLPHYTYVRASLLVTSTHTHSSLLYLDMWCRDIVSFYNYNQYITMCWVRVKLTTYMLYSSNVLM